MKSSVYVCVCRCVGVYVCMWVCIWYVSVYVYSMRLYNGVCVGIMYDIDQYSVG